MNPDKALIERFIASGMSSPMAMDSNPMAVALGAEILTADRVAGEITMRFNPAELFVQGAGVLQGGALAAMADFAMAFAAMLKIRNDQSPSTTNLDTAFLRAAPRGPYRVIGKVEKAGRQIIFTSAHIFPEHNPARPVVSATSTLLVLDAGD